ncbi:hypothetical protein CHS0354_017950 [Potamilus streckersoni]|uniref:Uncharacterized protein n=1 Tax=Potamilus streckersoni TaxID=2493646 RepID=A0AAE0RW09_9BIVA|nr:hypothetical protein CHS0354_017950 [Potamilus streckersoni]
MVKVAFISGMVWVGMEPKPMAESQGILGRGSSLMTFRKVENVDLTCTLAALLARRVKVEDIEALQNIGKRRHMLYAKGDESILEDGVIEVNYGLLSCIKFPSDISVDKGVSFKKIYSHISNVKSNRASIEWREGEIIEMILACEDSQILTLMPAVIPQLYTTLYMTAKE